MAQMTYDLNGLKLTESFEGLRLVAYKDVHGIWTIGYGHTGAGVYSGLVIDTAMADTLLQGDILHAALCVNRLVTHSIDQNQFDALVDFTFNVGIGSFQSSAVLKAVNAGNIAAAAVALMTWDKSGGRVFDGLVRRRTAERAFLIS